MRKIILRGRLGRKFGKVWNLDVKTVKDVFAAIDANTNGEFCQYILDTINSKNIAYKIVIGGSILDNKEGILVNFGNQDMEIVPCGVIKGIDPVTLLVYVAVSIVLTVISMLLAPTPQINTGTDNGRKDAYLFSGGPNPARQGKPVPIGYGEMMVYPITISANYEYINLINEAPPVTTSETPTNIPKIKPYL